MWFWGALSIIQKVVNYIAVFYNKCNVMAVSVLFCEEWHKTGWMDQRYNTKPIPDICNKLNLKNTNMCDMKKYLAIYWTITILWSAFKL